MRYADAVKKPYMDLCHSGTYCALSHSPDLGVARRL